MSLASIFFSWSEIEAFKYQCEDIALLSLQLKVGWSFYLIYMLECFILWVTGNNIAFFSSSCSSVTTLLSFSVYWLEKLIDEKERMEDLRLQRLQSLLINNTLHEAMFEHNVIRELQESIEPDDDFQYGWRLSAIFISPGTSAYWAFDYLTVHISLIDKWKHCEM